MSYSSHGECVSAGVKARVMYSRMLSDEEYWGLLNCDTVGEIVTKLRSSEGYREHLMSLPPGDVRRYDLEAALKNSLLREAEAFLIHLSNPRDAFFRTWIAWYEAENLKSVFRFVASKRENRDDLRRRLYPIPATKVSYENLLAAKDFSELAEVMKRTPYYKVLAEPFKRLMSGEEETLFSLEMAIDSFVELLLYKNMKKLEPGEQRALLPIFGGRIDMLNLYILYRAMKFYSMTPEETLNRLLPVRHRVTLGHLKELVRSGTAEAAVDSLQNTFPAYAEALVGSLKQDQPQLALERNIKRYTYNQALRTFRSGAPGFHTAMSYFLLREFEIEDLIHITEDVRYGYDKRHAAEYLIRPILTGGENKWQ